LWSHQRTVERKDFAEEEELLSMLSELMSEISPGMVLRVFADRGISTKVSFCQHPE
jgi:hypothetical protein